MANSKPKYRIIQAIKERTPHSVMLRDRLDQIAEKANTTRNTIYSWDQIPFDSKRVCSRLVELSHAIGCPISELMNRDTDITDHIADLESKRV